MLPERKELMHRTRARVCGEVKTLLRDFGLNPELTIPLFALWDKRTRRPGIRSGLCSALYYYVQEQAQIEDINIRQYKDDDDNTGNERLFLAQIPMLAESVIAFQYYQNQVLDGKGGLRIAKGFDKTKIDRHVIGSDLLKESLYEYIDLHIFANPAVCKENKILTRALRKMYQYVDIGQMMQEQWGNYETFKSGLQKYVPLTPEMDGFVDYSIIDEFCSAFLTQGVDAKHEYFVRNYLKRIYFTSGALFYKFAESIMKLMEYEEKGKERTNILKFMTITAMVGQLRNDIDDFKEHMTVEKINEDVFSDIRNNIVTPPLIFYFIDNPSKDINYLQSLMKIKPLWYKLMSYISKKFDQKLYLQEIMQPYLEKSLMLAEQMAEFANRHLNKSNLMERILADFNDYDSTSGSKDNKSAPKPTGILA